MLITNFVTVTCNPMNFNIKLSKYGNEMRSGVGGKEGGGERKLVFNSKLVAGKQKLSLEHNNLVILYEYERQVFFINSI